MTSRRSLPRGKSCRVDEEQSGRVCVLRSSLLSSNRLAGTSVYVSVPSSHCRRSHAEQPEKVVPVCPAPPAPEHHLPPSAPPHLPDAAEFPTPPSAATPPERPTPEGAATSPPASPDFPPPPPPAASSSPSVPSVLRYELSPGSTDF